jgi:apolipoprotein D and lipocalin family protein
MRSVRFFLLFILGLCGPVNAAERSLATVGDLDLERYLGDWYQIALLPNRFQAKCRGETQAHYSRMESGAIRVINECRLASGERIEAQGEARLNDAFGDPARLEVRFAPRWLAWLGMVWGDYWILAIDDGYTAVLVGAPDRRYLWVLARQPQMSAERYAAFLEIAQRQGYDLKDLQREPGTQLID